MKKLVVMERMVIQINKRMERGTRTKFLDILHSYDVEPLPYPWNKELDKKAVKAKDFCRMLERMGVIQSCKKQDTKYLFNEYGFIPEDDKLPYGSKGGTKPPEEEKMKKEEANQFG